MPMALEVPLKIEENGAIRVEGTRVLLEVVIAAHQRFQHRPFLIVGLSLLSV